MFAVGLFIVPSAEFYFLSSDRLNYAANIAWGTTLIRLF